MANTEYSEPQLLVNTEGPLFQPARLTGSKRGIPSYLRSHSVEDNVELQQETFEIGKDILNTGSLYLPPVTWVESSEAPLDLIGLNRHAAVSDIIGKSRSWAVKKQAPYFSVDIIQDAGRILKQNSESKESQEKYPSGKINPLEKRSELIIPSLRQDRFDRESNYKSGEILSKKLAKNPERIEFTLHPTVNFYVPKK